MESINLDISYRTIFKVIFAVAVAVFLFLIHQIILALFAAFVISTVTSPLADFFEKKKIPRVLTASMIYIAILILVGLLFFAITPSLIKEISALALRFPQYITENIAKYPILEQYNIRENIDKIVLSISGFLKAQSFSFFISTISALGNLFYIFLVLAVSFYLTIERNLLKRYFKKIVHRDHHENLIEIFDEIEFKMGKWFVGQIVLSFITGVAIFLGLSILGVPFALSLAVLAAILRFIPFLGALISDAFGILIALLSSPMLGVAAFLMYYIIQQIEAYILIPLVMRQTVGLNPVIVITAVISGGKIGGVSGALLAIPITIVAVILVKRIILKEKS